MKLRKSFFQARTISGLFALTSVIWCLTGAGILSFADDGFKTFVDSRGRFSIEYPSTMTVDSRSPDELKFSHPSASLRISLDVIKRPGKSSLNTKTFIETMKKTFQEEFKNSTLIGEGASANDPNQFYLIYTFTDKRGIKLTQLTQFFVGKERILQLIISDKPEGFKNLESVITRIRNSMKITNSSLE